MSAMLPFLGQVERLILVRDGYYHADDRTRRRAAMILAMDRGDSPTKVAKVAQCTKATVYYWLHRYLQHRDVKVLSNGQSSDQEARSVRIAEALNRMKPGKAGKPGRLRWNERSKAELRLDARIAPDPSDRLKAAILWAIDRGIPQTHVAHLLGLSRMSVYRLLKRANSQEKMRNAKVRLISQKK